MLYDMWKYYKWQTYMYLKGDMKSKNHTEEVKMSLSWITWHREHQLFQPPRYLELLWGNDTSILLHDMAALT